MTKKNLKSDLGNALKDVKRDFKDGKYHESREKHLKELNYERFATSRGEK